MGKVVSLNLFTDREDGVFKGKHLSVINRSKEGYNGLLSLFGGKGLFPSSIMRLPHGGAMRAVDEEKDEIVAGRTYTRQRDAETKRRLPGIPRDLMCAYHVSGSGCSSGALSSFPQAVGRSVVLFYSEPGDTVFDPFAGHNSRMELCVKAGRRYVGCDLSNEFMDFNEKRACKLKEMHPTAQIELHRGCSTKVPVPSLSADFTITSPPYWDIEYYGDEPQQLGKAKTYCDFLDLLLKVIKENYRVLRSGAYAAWFVNDFRRNGKMHFYHADVLRLARKAGFLTHDIMIVDFGRGIRDCFANQTFEIKILPKRHEYGLIFRKPEEIEGKSPKHGGNGNARTVKKKRGSNRDRR